MEVPQLIHEQQGLKIVKNIRNGFIVASLYYYADPAKRSAEWKRAAAQGMSKSKFEQEYEINYSAMFGEKVFPEIKSRSTEIIVPTGPYIDDQWPTDIPMYGGFDYGARNPSSFHVYAIFDSIIYAVWELYEPCKNIIEFAEKMKACPYWNQLRYISSDPSIFDLHQRDMSTGMPSSVFDQLYQLGIHKLVKSSTDEAAWLAQMQKHWLGSEVTFKIHKRCYQMIDEFEQATYIQMSDRQLEGQNYKEKLVDKHNHALDDCKYFMNSRPSLKTKRTTLPTPLTLYGFGRQKKDLVSGYVYN